MPKEAYKETYACIKTEFGTTEYIKIEWGVKQGCVWSCFCFILLLSSVLTKTKSDIKSERGDLQIGVKIEGEVLTDIGYSDDMTLMDENVENLQLFLTTFNQNSQKVGLNMNIPKTKVMKIAPGEENRSKIVLNGQAIEEVK